MTAWDWCAWGLLLLWIRRSASAWFGFLRPQTLARVTPWPGSDLPTVSLIVPARDEIRAIENALRTMLTLDYPSIEIIAVNDRSTDGTGEVMDRIAAEDSRLKPVHVRELPAGWLGKNHANHIGVQAAGGEYILLTDGDILFDPALLRRALRIVRERRLDHLVLLPDVLPETFAEKVIVNFFSVLLLLASEASFTRFPWARNAYLGVGAFNLLSRRAYDQIGGHLPLRMEVADDMCLGKLVKQAGLRQDVFMAHEHLKVKWQHGGVWGIIRGLEKNSFAAMHFSIGRTLVGCSALALVMIVVPLISLFRLGSVPVDLIAASNLALFTWAAIFNGYPLLAGILYPMGAAIFIYIMLRSTWITLRTGGIRWRDTFYPLKELRAGKVP